jgi:hypothetical protein
MRSSTRFLTTVYVNKEAGQKKFSYTWGSSRCKDDLNSTGRQLDTKIRTCSFKEMTEGT